MYNASTSKKYWPSSSTFPSKVSAARLPLCDKSAKAILGGGAGTATGGTGCIGGNGGKVHNCVAGGAAGVAWVVVDTTGLSHIAEVDAWSVGGVVGWGLTVLLTKTGACGGAVCGVALGLGITEVSCDGTGDGVLWLGWGVVGWGLFSGAADNVASGACCCCCAKSQALDWVVMPQGTGGWSWLLNRMRSTLSLLFSSLWAKGCSEGSLASLLGLLKMVKLSKFRKLPGISWVRSYPASVSSFNRFWGLHCACCGIFLNC